MTVAPSDPRTAGIAMLVDALNATRGEGTDEIGLFTVRDEDHLIATGEYRTRTYIEVKAALRVVDQEIIETEAYFDAEALYDRMASHFAATIEPKLTFVSGTREELDALYEALAASGNPLKSAELSAVEVAERLRARTQTAPPSQ